MQQFHLQWDHDSKELMTFELQVQSTGWVAFGFSIHGELPGADVVIGGVLPDGNMYFSVSRQQNLLFAHWGRKRELFVLQPQIQI